MSVWTFCVHWEVLRQQIIKAEKNLAQAMTSSFQRNRYNLDAMLRWPYYPAPNIYASECFSSLSYRKEFFMENKGKLTSHMTWLKLYHLKYLNILPQTFGHVSHTLAVHTAGEPTVSFSVTEGPVCSQIPAYMIPP